MWISRCCIMKNQWKIKWVLTAEYFKAYNEGLLVKQNPKDVEVVTGATHAHTSFVEYANKLIEAKKGDTAEIKVEAPKTNGLQVKTVNSLYFRAGVFSLLIE